MFVLVSQESNKTCYLSAITFSGIENTNCIDYAIKFSRTELEFFIPYLEFILGMDYAYFYKIFEL